MKLSNYSNGFPNGVSIRNMPLLNTYANDVFWVHSATGSDGNKGTDRSPFKTLDYAVGRCTADRGDIILVKPGHTETVSTDGGLAIDVDRIEIIGLGAGDTRPLIDIGTDVAAAMITSGAGVVMHGFRVLIAKDAATDPIQFSGAGGEFFNWEIAEASAVEALDLLSISPGGTRTILHDMVIRGRNTGDGDALNAIHLDGCDDVQIYNMDITGGDWSEGVIFNQGDEVLNIRLHDLILGTKAPEDLTIVMDANATGEMWEIKNILFDNAANIDECIVDGKLHSFDPILVVNADGEKAIEWAGTDSVDT